ncbi:MAG: short-chain dehydrogenase/reductase [Bacteroidetes bacterium GWF2_40_14]|nr:MAG: short-chain dehydrogenase/reductase [Bacteroidetes bacterium GWF2_40_14]
MSKVVFITGISSGFGRAMAIELTNNGHKVYGSIRSKVDPIPKVNYVRMDVTDISSIEQAVKEIYDKEGRIDVLINNAGIGIGGPIELTNIRDAQYQMDVNFFGVFRVTQAVLPIMRKQKDGVIIYISSIGGLMGIPFQGLYSASKFAIEGYCQSLSLELKPHDIRVVLVNPGDFSTSFTSNRKIVDNPEIKLTYPQFYNTLSIITSDESNGPKPEILAKKIKKIVYKKRPAFRYVIASPLQKFSVSLKRLLPETWFAAILKKYYD